MAERRLPLRHQQFVDAYLADPDLNATRAYRSVYPKCKNDKVAGVNAAQLLASPRIQAAIATARKDLIRRTQLTHDWVLKRLRIEALRQGEGSSHSARVSAAKAIGEHLGMFPKKVQHSGPDGKSIDVKVAHDTAAIEPYRAALAAFAVAVLAGPAHGAVPPDGAEQPVHTPQTNGETGALPAGR